VSMDVRELARGVAARTGLSREESADISRAVLEGLAAQLSEGEAKNLAVDLPDPLAGELDTSRRRRKGAHPVPVLNFIRQIGARTGLPEHDARTGTGAVLAVLSESLGDAEYRHLMGQLPAAYSELVGAAG
jgi:uncharacterized protein (DUF2267 family)